MDNMPKNWENVAIEEVLALLENGNTTEQGWSPRCENYSVGNSDHWGVLKTTAIQDGQFLPEYNKQLPEKLSPRIQLEINSGDILMTSAGPRTRCGITCLVESTPRRLMMSGKMYRFRTYEKYLRSKYLTYYLRSQEAKEAIDQMKTGISDSGLNLTHNRFRRLSIPLAPTNEQDRITTRIEELLSELDVGVDSLKTARQQLKVYRQSLLKHAFEGKVTEQWRKENTVKHETVSQLLERVKDEREVHYDQQLDVWKIAVEEWEENGAVGKKPPKPRKLISVNHENIEKKIKSLPDSWHSMMIGDIVLSLGQGWSPKCNPIEAGVADWGVIKTTAIQDLHFNEKENKQLPTGIYARPWLEIKENDILITRAGPRNRVGVVCRVRRARKKLMLCDKAYRMRFSDNIALSPFIEAFFSTPLFRKNIEMLKTGISDSGLNITQPRLLGLQIPTPPLEEQYELVRIISNRLSVIDKTISDISSSIDQHISLQQSILKKAFSGKLVAQDPSDEPAKILLKRIQEQKSINAKYAERKINP
jgi:type I restriction enzyme, S subunit